MALAHSRGLFDYEERVCTYWPEFAQQGKEKVTVRQLLSHQAGLPALDVPMDKSIVAELDRLYLGKPDAKFFGDAVPAELQTNYTPVRVKIAPTHIRVEG